MWGDAVVTVIPQTGSLCAAAKTSLRCTRSRRPPGVPRDCRGSRCPRLRWMHWRSSPGLYIFTVCRSPRRKASARSPATSGRAPRTSRRRRPKGAARCGRSSTATRGRPARATTTAGERSTSRRARSASAPRPPSSRSASNRSSPRNESPDLVRPLRQPLPRLRARLHLLLRAADAQLPRPLAGARLRDQDHRQGQCGRAAAREARAAAATSRRRSTSARRTDAYQPIERRLGITRAVVEVLAECAHPFSLVTKSSRGRARPRSRRRRWPSAGSPRSMSR